MHNTSFLAGINRLVLAFFLLIASGKIPVSAQNDVNLTVQVNRLPDGSYPVRLHQFYQTPGLVRITVVNRTRKELNLYLNGKITGDNGVLVTTVRGYQPASINLRALETKTLNAIEAGNLFDPNFLEFRHGGGNFSPTVLGEQALPEGTYQVCLQAFAVENNQVLSDEEPIGCSNMFTISLLEPPIILSPMPDEEIHALPVQNISLRWTAPPGSPPSTEYTIRIVELFGDRNPDDAMLSTAVPFFETKIIGTPFMLYGPVYPQFHEGRSYAIRIQAKDPFTGRTFRNNGFSEVVGFVYGSSLVKTDSVPNSGNGIQGKTVAVKDTAPQKALASNTIRGQLVFSFRDTESGIMPVPDDLNTMQASTIMETPAVSEAFLKQVAETPLIRMQLLRALQTDPTLRATRVVNTFKSVPALMADQETRMSTAVISATQSLKADITTTSTDFTATGNRTYPLEGIQLSLVALHSNPKLVTILGTTQTNAEGVFKIDYLHPAYFEQSGFTGLEIRLSTKDFTQTSFRISLDTVAPDQSKNMGTIRTVARTCRLYTKLTTDEQNGKALKPVVAAGLYRREDALLRRPYLKYEGEGLAEAAKAADGMSMVATLATNQSNGISAAGRLFFGDDLILQVHPEDKGLYGLTSHIRIDEGFQPAPGILAGRVQYQLATKPGILEGSISVRGKGQIIPVEGAVLRLRYLKADLLNPGGAIIDASSTQSVSLSMASAVVTAQNPSRQESDGLHAQYTAFARTPAIFLQGGAGSQTLRAEFAAPVQSSLINGDPNFVNLYCNSDEIGGYSFSNLPELKPGKQFILEVAGMKESLKTAVVTNTSGDLLPGNYIISRGETKHVDLNVLGVLMEVSGRVVDHDGKPIPGAVIYRDDVRIKTAEQDGSFELELFQGEHILFAKKAGYFPGKIVIKPQELQPVQANGKGQQKQAATIFLGPRSFTPTTMALDIKDVGFLKPAVCRVRFRVIDKKTGNPISGATISLFEKSGMTSASGEWVYEGQGGRGIVTVLPPEGTRLVSERKSVDLEPTETENVETIPLESGLRVNITVISSGKPVDQARIQIPTSGNLEILTNASGKQTINLIPGSHQFRATRSGYVGSKIDVEIQADGTNVQIELASGGSKNISSFLGFTVELNELKPGSGSGEIWSGELIPTETQMATGVVSKRNQRIPFTNCAIHYDASGQPIPDDGKIHTDLTQWSGTLFGFLPVIWEDPSGLIITANANKNGTLRAKVLLDNRVFTGSSDWIIPSATDLFLSNSMGLQELVAFSSDRNERAIPAQLELKPETGNAFQSSLFGFTLQVSGPIAVNQTGLRFAATLQTPEFPGVSAAKIRFREIWLNNFLHVESVQADITSLPQIQISRWKMTLQQVSVADGAFTTGGHIEISIPGSSAQRVEFSGLQIAHDAIYGGKFILPEAGFDLAGIASIQTKGTSMSLGRVGNSQVWKVGGKADLHIPLDIFKEDFHLQVFEWMSDGQFKMIANMGYETKVGPFEFSVSNLYVHQQGGRPGLGVQGNFKADIQLVSFDLSDIRVGYSAGKLGYTVNKIGVKLDVPVVKISAQVDLQADGFSGKGSVSIPGTPIDVTAGFGYFKRNGITDLFANFSTNLPPLPIGGPVTLEGIGGGFKYVSGGSNGGFTVDVFGKISFAGTGTIVALDKVGISVSSRGILRGYGDVTVGTYFKMARAEMTLNGPERLFSVNVKASFAPFADISKMDVSGALLVSAKPEDPYVFLGCGLEVNMLKLIDARGEMALAINLKNPMSRQSPIGYYFRHAQTQYLGETFSGAYLNAFAKIGVPREHAIGLDIKIAAVKAWFSSTMNAGMVVNFANSNYMMNVSGAFDGGAEISVLGAAVSTGVYYCYNLNGSKTPADGWQFGGILGGDISASIGCACGAGCNEVNYHPLGGFQVRVCAAAQLGISYKQKGGGLNFDFTSGSGGIRCQ